MDVIDKAIDLLERDQHSECFEVLTAEIARLRATLEALFKAVENAPILANVSIALNDAMREASKALANERLFDQDGDAPWDAELNAR